MIQPKQKTDFSDAVNRLRPAGRFRIGISIACVLVAALATIAATPGKAPPTPVRTKPAPPPAVVTPAAKAMKQLAFLSGNWEGKLDSYPVRLDISINGQYESPANLMKFTIHAKPTMGIKLGIEGDYNSVVSYSTQHQAIRAVLTDVNGRGVEMLGEKVQDQPEWLFNSTGDGSPFPFKVRLRPITSDTVVVNYTSGGRMSLKYEITFNRVQS